MLGVILLCPSFPLMIKRWARLDLGLLGFIAYRIMDRPFDLEFAITYRCNLRCIQCDVWRYDQENPHKAMEELGIEEIQRIFSSYDGLRVIGITGGEPFLRGDLDLIVKTISKSQKHLEQLFITTNGQLTKIAKEKVEAILEMRERSDGKFSLHILVSIDGPPEIHDRIRGMAGAYGKALYTLKALSGLRDHFDFSLGTVTVLSPFNIDRFDEVLEEARSIKAEYGTETSFCIWFTGQLYKNERMGREIRVEDFRESLKRRVGDIKALVRGDGSMVSRGRSIFYDLLKLWLEDPRRQVIPCGGASARYFLDPYGNLYPCTIYGARIGNLRDNSYDLERLIDSEERRRVREAVKAQRCPICCNTCETIPAMMAYPERAAIKWLSSKVFRK